MIIKDSLVSLKGDTSSLSNTYRGLHGKTNKKLKTFMAHILKPAFEFGKQAAKFLSTSHHINHIKQRKKHVLSCRLRLLTERSGWQVILLFFEELGGISIPLALTSAIAGQSMTFFSKAAIFYSKALKPVLIRIPILSSLLRMASEISLWFPSTI